MLRCSKPVTQANILMVNSYSAILILKLCDLYGNEARIRAEDRRFMDSLSLIYCNYSEKVTTERLAGTALMSRSAYLKKFSEIFGTTPGCLLLDRRITAAKELLSSTQYPLDTIAERTGFYDASHLVRFLSGARGSPRRNTAGVLPRRTPKQIE